MKAIEDFFAKMKRLLQTGPRADSADTGPPAAADVPPIVEAARTAYPEPPPSTAPTEEPIGAEPPEEPTPATPRESTIPDSSPALAELSELLRAVSEPSPAIEVPPESPAVAPEPTPATSVTADERTAPSPSSTADDATAPVDDVGAPAVLSPSDEAASPTLASAEAGVEAPIAIPGKVGDVLVLTGGSAGAPAVTFTVARSSATLGRAPENTIRLDDLSVSRRHARIAYRQGGYWLSDLGSMGGTWLDGTRLNAARRISAGQVIDIGLLRLTVGFTTDERSVDATRKTNRARSEMAGQGRRRQ